MCMESYLVRFPGISGNLPTVRNRSTFHGRFSSLLCLSTRSLIHVIHFSENLIERTPIFGAWPPIDPSIKFLQSITVSLVIPEYSKIHQQFAPTNWPPDQPDDHLHHWWSWSRRQGVGNYDCKGGELDGWTVFFWEVYIYIWDRGDFRAPWSCCFSNLLG